MIKQPIQLDDLEATIKPVINEVDVNHLIEAIKQMERDVEELFKYHQPS